MTGRFTALGPHGRAVLVYASAGHMLCHASQLMLRLVLPVAALQLGVDQPRLGWVVTAYTLAMGLSSLPGGLWADRAGAGRVLVAYFWMLAGAAALCFLAPGFWAFLGAHALLGAAAGLYHPAGLGLISLSVERERLGWAMGVHGVAASLAIALTPVLMLVAESQAGWRWAFALLALAAASCAWIGGSLLRRGLLVVPPRAAAVAGIPVSARRALGVLLLVVVVNAFLLEGFTTTLAGAVETQGDVRWGQWVELIAIFVLGGFGQYVGGLAAGGPWTAARYALVVALQPALLLFTAGSLGGDALPLVLMSSFAFANYMTQPIENQILAGYTSRARRSTAYAVKFLVGAVLAAPAAALSTWVAETSGYPRLYLVLASVGVAGMVAAVVFLRVARRVTQRGESAG